MAWLESLPSGKVRVVWRSRRTGKQTSRACPSEREAKRLKRKVEAAHAQGREWTPEATRDQRTAEQLAEQWLMEAMTRRAPRTVIRKQQMVGYFVQRLHDEHGDPVYLCDLDLEVELVAHHAWLRQPVTGRHMHGRAESTTVRHIQEIERFLRWCWDKREIPHPPSLKLDRPVPPARPAPTWDEMDACLSVLTGWHWRLGVVMRCTGLRVNQVMRLRWDDIDMASGVLWVRPALGKTRREKKGRHIPLAPVLLEELAGWGVREGWLVPCARQKREARARDFQRAWRRSGVRPAVWAKLEDSKGRAHHAFRAGYKTGLLRLGVEERVRDFLLGHSRGVDESYEDPGMEVLRRAVALVPPIGGAPLRLRKTEEG